MRPIIWLLVLVLGCVTSAPVGHAAAQEQPDLIVTLRDEAGRGLAGVTVVVRTATSTAPLATGITDATGSVAVPALPVAEVQVLVQGTVAGVPLIQAGADADGVRVLLGAPPTVLDLRADTTGHVIPDPVTMIARDPVPVAPIGPPPDLAAVPVAPPAPADVLPQQATPGPAARPAAPPAAAPAPAAHQPVTGPILLAIIIGIVLVLIVGLALVSAARNRRPT